MNNNLQKSETSLANIQIEFTPDQIQLIKDQIAVGANDNELKLFLYQCSRTGLDPLTRQIYCIKRGGRMTIQTSIDGFRVIAERSGEYAGQDKPVFGMDGDKLFCEVAVYRFAKSGARYQASVGVAYWLEYCPQAPNDLMWRKMPRTMLSKVAEALALRKAFPQDLSGLYTNDEMVQDAEVTPTVAAPTTPAPVAPTPPEFYTPQVQSVLENYLFKSTYEQGSPAYKAIKHTIEDANNMTKELFERVLAGLKTNQLPDDQLVQITQKVIKAKIAKEMRNDEMLHAVNGQY